MLLALIAMFTQMHIFWIGGLLLALVDLPDFGTPLKRIAGATEKITGVEPREAEHQTPTSTSIDQRTDDKIGHSIQRCGHESQK